MEWSSHTTNTYVYKSKIEKTMSDIFSAAITQDEEESYTPQLRGSSLPICILLHAQSLLQPHVRAQTARLEHYSVQGTVFHEWYQKKLMQSKRYGKYVYGDFECARCETVYFKNCCRPSVYKSHVCTKCGNIGLRYKELAGKYRGVIGVHVDMVLKFPGDKYWVIEFKTTGSFNLKDAAFDAKNKHHHQASSYPVVLEDVFKIKPERYFIVYVNRDTPQYSKTSMRQHRVFPFSTKSNIVTVRRAQLDKIVEGEKARIKYFKNPTLKNLKALDALRPCKSLSDYKEPLVGMKDKFESNESCPYVRGSKCKCFQTDKLSKAAKDLHEMLTKEK